MNINMEKEAKISVIVVVFFVSLTCFVSCGQKKNISPLLLRNDLSYLIINPDSVPTYDVWEWWTEEAKATCTYKPANGWYVRTEPLGYRGQNFQRFYIHFDQVRKKCPTIYEIIGRTRCKDEYCRIKGYITIDTVVSNDDGSELQVVEEVMHIKDFGHINAHYKFDAFSNNKRIAQLFGTVLYDYLLHNDSLYYDAVMSFGDGYCNNQYTGKWVYLDSKDTLTCNWGDFRIPESNKLDIGCGLFSPSEEYYEYGWEMYKNYCDSIYTADENWWKTDNNDINKSTSQKILQQ